MDNEDKQHLIGISLDEFRTKLYKMSNEFLFSHIGKLYMFEMSCTIVEKGDLKFFAMLVVFLERKKLVNSKYLSAWMTIAIQKHHENVFFPRYGYYQKQNVIFNIQHNTLKHNQHYYIFFVCNIIYLMLHNTI